MQICREERDESRLPHGIIIRPQEEEPLARPRLSRQEGGHRGRRPTRLWEVAQCEGRGDPTPGEPELLLGPGRAEGMGIHQDGEEAHRTMLRRHRMEKEGRGP